MFDPTIEAEAYPLALIIEDVTNTVTVLEEDLDHLAEHLRAARAEDHPARVLDLSVAGDHVQRAWASLRLAQSVLSSCEVRP